MPPNSWLIFLARNMTDECCRLINDLISNITILRMLVEIEAEAKSRKMMTVESEVNDNDRGEGTTVPNETVSTFDEETPSADKPREQRGKKLQVVLPHIFPAYPNYKLVGPVDPHDDEELRNTKCDFEKRFSKRTYSPDLEVIDEETKSQLLQIEESEKDLEQSKRSCLKLSNGSKKKTKSTRRVRFVLPEGTEPKNEYMGKRRVKKNSQAESKQRAASKGLKKNRTSVSTEGGSFRTRRVLWDAHSKTKSASKRELEFENSYMVQPNRYTLRNRMLKKIRQSEDKEPLTFEQKFRTKKRNLKENNHSVKTSSDKGFSEKGSSCTSKRRSKVRTAPKMKAYENPDDTDPESKRVVTKILQREKKEQNIKAPISILKPDRRCCGNKVSCEVGGLYTAKAESPANETMQIKKILKRPGTANKNDDKMALQKETPCIKSILKRPDVGGKGDSLVLTNRQQILIEDAGKEPNSRCDAVVPTPKSSVSKSSGNFKGVIPKKSKSGTKIAPVAGVCPFI